MIAEKCDMPFSSYREKYVILILTTIFGGAVNGNSIFSNVILLQFHNIRKNTVAIDGTPKDCGNRRNRIQPSKIKN
jgi:hypothetical protein